MPTVYDKYGIGRYNRKREQVTERRERLPDNREIQVRFSASLPIYPSPSRLPRSNIFGLSLQKSYWN